MLLYLIATLAYSLSLKRKLFADVLTLGVLYMVRVLAGGVAVSVTLSPWFLAFFMFAFLALAVGQAPRRSFVRCTNPACPWPVVVPTSPGTSRP